MTNKELIEYNKEETAIVTSIVSADIFGYQSEPFRPPFEDEDSWRNLP